MKGSMDRVQRGGPWTGSTGVVHGPGSMFCIRPPCAGYTQPRLAQFCSTSNSSLVFTGGGL